MSNFGFPLTADDLRYAVKSYLDRTGRSVKRFNNNMPGKEWTKSFLQRHPLLSERFAANIKKKNRAAIDEKIISEYIDNLRIVVQDIPPNRIWNFDETNISDNPGQKKVLVRRGMKYPEKVCNFSKSNISVVLWKCCHPVWCIKLDRNGLLGQKDDLMAADTTILRLDGSMLLLSVIGLKVYSFQNCEECLGKKL